MAEPGAASAGHGISFGPFRLLRTQRLLLEGDKVLRIGSRALDLLIALAEHPGELVGKDELIARVWPDTNVEEANLKVHISALRRALGDGSAGRRYIATVAGRGYSFVASQSLVPVETPHRQRSRTEHLHNLPARLTRLIGRGQIVDSLLKHLPRQRLLTIAGPGGIGKTSVALAVAEGRIGEVRPRRVAGRSGTDHRCQPRAECIRDGTRTGDQRRQAFAPFDQRVARQANADRAGQLRPRAPRRRPFGGQPVASSTRSARPCDKS